MSYGKKKLTEEQERAMAEQRDFEIAVRTEKVLTGVPISRRFSREKLLQAAREPTSVWINGKKVGELDHLPQASVAYADPHVVTEPMTFAPGKTGSYHIKIRTDKP